MRWILATGLAAGLALAGGAAAAFEEDAPVAMLRLALPFGGAAPGLGLSGVDLQLGVSPRGADGLRQGAPALLDFRYDFAGDHALAFGGVEVARRVRRLGANGEMSETWEAWDNTTWLWLGGAAVLVGAAAFIEFDDGDDGDDDEGGGTVVTVPTAGGTAP